VPLHDRKPIPAITCVDAAPPLPIALLTAVVPRWDLRRG